MQSNWFGSIPLPNKLRLRGYFLECKFTYHAEWCGKMLLGHLFSTVKDFCQRNHVSKKQRWRADSWKCLQRIASVKWELKWSLLQCSRRRKVEARAAKPASTTESASTTEPASEK